jgi:hypothetical protein
MATSFYAKETGITVGAVLIAYEWLLHRDSPVGTVDPVQPSPAAVSESNEYSGHVTKTERSCRDEPQEQVGVVLRRRMREAAACENFLAAARLKKQAALLMAQATLEGQAALTGGQGPLVEAVKDDEHGEHAENGWAGTNVDCNYFHKSVRSTVVVLVTCALLCVRQVMTAERDGGGFVVRNFRRLDNQIPFIEDYHSRWLTILYTYFVYAKLLIAPLGLSCDYSYSAVPNIQGYSDPRNLMTLGLAVLILVILSSIMQVLLLLDCLLRM